MTDIALEYPILPKDAKKGLWPSAVAVTANPHAPMRFNHQESLEYYRMSQHSYGILWAQSSKDAEKDVAVYRLFNEIPGPFAPDYRLTERGEFELVGLSKIPDQPPGPSDGGSAVPAVPSPNSPEHPSMSGG